MQKLFVKFLVVGASGVVVNLAVYSALFNLHINYMVAAMGSFVVAVSNNFYWNFIWTFKGRAPEKSVRRKYVGFFVVSLINFGVNLIILKYLVDVLYFHKIVAQVIAIGAASLFNFILNYKFTFR